MTAEDHELQHQEARSFLDYLKLIFHEDMGEGHLEHVVVSSSLNLQLQLTVDELPPCQMIAFSAIQANRIERPSKTDQCFDHLPFHHSELHQFQRFRGPPALT